MYRFSIRKDNKEDKTYGISNIELKDGYYGAPLDKLTADKIEDIRADLIGSLERIVLYTVNIPLAEYDRYVKLFRNAHLLNIENVKLCLCTLGGCTDKDFEKLSPIIELARAFGIKLLFEPGAKHPSFTYEMYGKIRSGTTGLIFNPLLAVLQGKNPFLKVLYKNKYKDDIVFLRVNDGLYGDGTPVLPELGNSEIKECASALLSRSFGGYFSFIPYMERHSVGEIIKAFQGTLTRM